MSVKVAYFLTDVSQPGRGNFMDKGSRELELPPGDNALWQSAYAELTAGV